APGGATEPAQRDLLAGLPPPPISEPISADPESTAMRRRRRNRRLLAAAAVIIVVAIGAWLWSGSKPSTEIPVVAADTTPEKIKPADEGGLQVPNQNVQVLENMDGAPAQAQGETVMPEPEQPVAPPAPSEAPSAEQAPTVVENAAPDSGTVTAEQAPAADAPPAPETPLTAAPLPEQSENDTAATTGAAPAAPAPQPTQTAEAPAAPEPAPAPTAAEPTPAPAPAATQPEPEPAQATQPEPAATQEAAITPVVPAGNTRVQLAAGKSEAQVQKDWAAMQKAHPALLGSLSLTIQKVDKGAAGIFYRLQAGPLADKAAARKLCASLKQQNQDCIVVTK
ncbi:MAG TPA: SPOR domain-containing protein, partial [Dongiaceae bacterium]|nr:SPOR domain-containing protein [Dongiaceae bacterium]